jgi:predicted acyltransferase
MLKSHGLWELVDNGASNPDPTPIDTTKRDAKALFFIQQAVHDMVFVKIAVVETAKKAWTILKIAFQGSSKVHETRLNRSEKNDDYKAFLTKNN